MRNKLKNYMIYLLKFGFMAFIGGALAMGGVRVVEYGFERPKIKMIVCLADDVGNIDVCENIDHE